MEEYNKGGWKEIKRKDLEELENEYGFLIQDNYQINFIGEPESKILKVNKIKEEKQEPEPEPSKRVITFNDSDLDSGLNITGNRDFLKENGLPLPSTIKNESYKNIKSYQKKAESLLSKYHNLLINKAVFKVEKGVNKAAKAYENPRTDTLKEINYYNILGEYVNNINKLVNIAKKTGQGIIHFNNPHQLLNRLELLAGSILAGNNGVKQEFSQIAHLLLQLKVITKKQLNDLLKKYILNK